jgi:alginate O-acetyltransferase complex protein AlgI
MVFCSPCFLFLFLPVVLLVYFLLPKAAWNLWLLAASLFFYAWGEFNFTYVMLASIGMNYGFGLLIERFRGRRQMKMVMGIATGANLALLIGFKYANFLVDMVNPLLGYLSVGPIHLAPVHLPIGISFFTFHALSYVIDVYRGDVRGEKKFTKVALYVTLFPQLIAGPILRFHNVAHQFGRRSVSLALFNSGVRRFLVGFGKKMLIANVVAVPADNIFKADAHSLSPAVAWLGIACYLFQIYFDFSGYSDMAVGLGRMFGFQFPENFNYPYISQSIGEFWRRWHISLSTWFRDYLYIPMGGNRVSPARNYLNLVTVFFLCGLWHGASWAFVVWGLYHGIFLILERLCLSRWLEKAYRPFRHAYAVVVVMIGFVFFRCETLSQALDFIGAMAGRNREISAALPTFLTREIQATLIVAIVGSTPILKNILLRLDAFEFKAAGRFAFESAINAAVLAIFALSLTYLAAGTYNPFIYFRF